MSDKPGEICPNDGSPMWRVSYREAYEELCEVSNSEPYAAFGVLERLVGADGSAVTVLCANTDGNGPDNRAIDVCDDWTKWQDLRFFGRTLFDALCNAEDARIKARKAETA